jgi:CubicO group peptidase (beta-lactamase class C family)
VELIREVALARPTVLLSFGSPYILSAVPEVASYLVAWGPQEVSQTAAAEALVGGVGISGRLPITLPPFHLRGEGLDRDAVPWVAELERGPRDELDETGMVVRRGEEPPGAGQTPALPACDPASPPMAKAVNLRAGPVEVDPGSVGMDPSRLLVSDSIVAAGVRAGAYPGAALAVGRSGRLVRLRGLGWFDPGCSGGEVRPDAIWDLASLTKVVGTTTAVMLLVEEGSLSLDDRVVDHLPGWDAGDPRKARVTVEDLLLHRAGLPPFRRFFTELEGRAAYRRAFAGLSLDYDPGTRTVYSDIGLQTAAHVVEAVSGMRLDAFLRERVWGPLGMLDTDFNPPGSKLWRVAPTEVDTVYRHVHVRGVVHDENAFAQGGVAGHAGLFSTARDLSVFARLMLGGGSVPVCRFGRGTPMDGDCDAADAREVRILDPGTVERFTRRFDDSSSRALGWDTPSEGSSSGSLLSSRAYGHTGFTGTSIWIDPEQDMFIILLTNRVNPTRENPRLFPIRRELADAVARSVAGPGQGGRP